MALGECDRHPSALAYTSWHKPATDPTPEARDLLVVLCAHCTNAHDLALIEQLFELSVDNRADLLKMANISPG